MESSETLPYSLKMSQRPDISPWQREYTYTFTVNEDLQHMNKYNLGVREAAIRCIVSDFERTISKVILPVKPKEIENLKSNKIVEMSVSWWENKRPIEWMVETHLGTPTVNCFNDAEKVLAEQVAAYVAESLG